MCFFRRKKTKKINKQRPSPPKRGPDQQAVTAHRMWSIGRESQKPPAKSAGKPAAKRVQNIDPRITAVTENRQRVVYRWPPEMLLRSFEHEECSWCRKFYTRPSQCPYNRYKLEKCDDYDKLDAGARRSLLRTPIWQVVIKEAMSKKMNPLSTVKCHYCGAVNPDPSVTRIWKCFSCDSKL